MKFLVGIDEAGRGPLAGPVAVGVVCVPEGFDWVAKLPGVDDSKKVSAAKREALCRMAYTLRHHRELNFAVAMVGASVIDEKGIVFAVNLAMKRCIARLALNPQQVSIRLDGALAAPPYFTQATIIKGDSLYPEIGLASILAKVTRDTYMERIDRRWPQYGFVEHKGYGTKVHREAIQKYGKCPIHRTTYCKNIK